MRVRGLVGLAAVAAVGIAGCSSGSSDPTVATSAPGPSEVSPASFTPLPQGKPFDITAADMTIHSFLGDPQTKSANFRLNCYPLWRDVETAKGKYNWDLFDLSVSNSQLWGAQVMMYSFCGTPEWAADGKAADPSVEVFGPQSSVPPKDLKDYEDYVRAVVKRYKGTISTYETWNEASSRSSGREHRSRWSR